MERNETWSSDWSNVPRDVEYRYSFDTAGRIYVFANLSILAGCWLFFLPSFAGIVLIPFFLLSFPFSLPVLFLLWALFQLFRKAALPARYCWTFLLLLVPLFAWLVYGLTEWALPGLGMAFVFPIALGAGYAGVLCQFRSIHKLYQSFSYEQGTQDH